MPFSKKGPSQYPFADPRPGPSREIIVHTYRPDSFSVTTPIVMVMSGRNRNAGEYRDFWIAEAEQRGLMIVAPEFAEARYPHPYTYNYGAMCNADGTLAPRAEWIFPVIEEIFRDARTRAGSERGRYFLFGHSAGAQLVHRLVIFGWSPSIERAIAANAGSYTLPSGGEDFPFGLGRVPVTDDVLRAIFARPLTIQLGDRDVDVDDEHLPREPAAMRQGPHRFARGRNFLKVARAEAARIGASLAWRIAIAPGVAHSGKDMASFAARELFGP